jgi:TolB-like protein
MSAARQRGFFAMLAIYVVGAWVVLQVAALAFPGWGIPDSTIRYVWTGVTLLLPVAAVFAWRYDITAQGLRRTVMANDVASAIPLGKSDYWFVSVLFILAGGISFAVVNEILDTRGTSVAEVSADIPANSIAVLSFVNMSDDDSNEYFSDGISEQLLNELARVPELHVAARTSAFFYKNKNESVQRMGAALGVRNLLEGSVRKHGDLVRITAQLIDTRNGYHLWSETYDRKLDDIFGVQSEIATAIVEVLKVKLLAQDRERLVRSMSKSVEAYDAYLRGMAMQQLKQPDSLEKSNAFFQQAIDLDPNFAVAYAALAYGYLLQPFSQQLSVKDAVALAEPLLQKALELQPDMEHAHASMGLLTSMLQRYDESDSHYQTALEINPNFFQGHVNYGLSLVYQSRLKEASAEYLRAQSLDPLNANLNRNLGLQLMLMGQFEDGLGFIENSLAIDPDFTNAKTSLVFWRANYGKLVEAIESGREVLEANPTDIEVIGSMVRAYMNIDLRSDAFDLLTSAQKISPDNSLVRFLVEYFWLTSGDVDAYQKFAEAEFQTVDANLGDSLIYGDHIRVHRYGRSLLMQGKYQEAADMLFWSAGGGEGVSATTYDFIFYLKYLALAYQEIDRHEEADELLDRSLELVAGARENGWATPFLFVRLAEIYALKGDTESAIDNIEIAVNKGWRDLGWLNHAPLLRNLRDEPEFIQIEYRLRQDLDAQQARLLSDAGSADMTD